MTVTVDIATPRIVEMVGPPGVGKSTLYKSICSGWMPTQNWVHQDELLAPGKPSIKKLDKWLEYNLRAALGKKRAKSIPVDFGLRFINKYEQLANFCWNHLSTSTSPTNYEIDKRFKSAYFLFSDFCRYQAILESGSPRACLIDEGFLQKSFLLQDEAQALNTLLDEYLSLVPAPHAILHLDVQDSTILTERLERRGKVISSHIGKSKEELRVDVEKWQHMLRAILGRLEQQGVQVYRLDGKLPVAENAQRAQELLKTL